jgi:hypothetical protein
MTVTLLDVSDCDADFKAWLKGILAANVSYPVGVYYKLPTNNGAWPAIVLYRSGGGKIAGEPNILNVRYGIEVLGGDVTPSQAVAVRQIAALLESAIDTISMVTQGGTTFLNGIVTSAPDKPDPDTGRPGRVLDAVITLRSATS